MDYKITFNNLNVLKSYKKKYELRKNKSYYI